jgi:hypothetical protein
LYSAVIAPGPDGPGAAVSRATGSAGLAPIRSVLLLLLLAILAGPAAAALGEWIDEGGAPVASFGLLLLVVSIVLAELGKSVERLVFSTKQRRWLRGPLPRWQRLILPFNTATLITRGMGATMAGGMVLLASGPGWSALSIVALGFVILSGGAIGFALSRLAVGLLIIHHSGPWRVSRRAWIVGGAVVVLATVANAAYSVAFVLQIAPAL